MKSLALLCVFFFNVLSIYAAGPIDDQIIQGKLDNGLTYYVRENPYPQGKASLRLVVKVGSMHEKDEEKGIAHFIEHLAFRGSEHFRDGEVMEYLESIGSWSGPDTNAYTSFDSTIYHIDIPLDNESALKKALAMLKDIACGVTLSVEGIEKERNVVLDELYHDRCSAKSRSISKIIESFLSHSPYIGHEPIGLEKIIKNVSQETLRNFYKKWYRPDLMAVIAIGDFDASAVQKKIEDHFSDIQLPEEAAEEIDRTVEYSDHPQCVVHFDSDLPLTEVSLISFFPIEADQDFSADDIKPALISIATNFLFENRLEKVKHKGSIFLDTGVDEGDFIDGTAYFFIGVELFEDHYEEGLQQLNREIQKVMQFGFSQREWKNLKKELETGWKRNLSNIDKTEHESYVSNCIDHFLNKALLVSEGWFLQNLMDQIKTLTIEEINESLTSSHLTDPFMIFLSTPSEKVFGEMSEERLSHIFYQEDVATDPEEEKPEAYFDLEPRFPKGEVIEIFEDQDTQVKYATLSNGIQLILKKTDLEHNELFISAQAKGGLAALDAKDIPSAVLANQYCQLSGLNGLVYDELLDLERSKGVHFHAKTSAGKRAFHVSSNSEHAQYAFKLLHEFFAAPQYAPNAWQYLIERKRELLKQHNVDTDTLFERFVSTVNTQDYFYFQPLDLDLAEEKTAIKMRECCFGAPQEFTFTVVGDFDPDEIVRLAEIYIASLPVNSKDPFPNLNVPEFFPKEKLHKEFKSGNKPYVTNVITIPYDFNHLFEKTGHTSSLEAIRKILHKRLEDILRNQLGNTYGVWVSRNDPFYPDFNNSALEIGFTCQAEHKEKMIALALEEIAQLKQNPPSDEEVSTIQALLLESKKRDSLSNGFWTNAIFWSQFQKVPLNAVLDYEENICALTPEKLYEAAQIIFASPHYSALSHLPEDH